MLGTPAKALKFARHRLLGRLYTKNGIVSFRRLAALQTQPHISINLGEDKETRADAPTPTLYTYIDKRYTIHMTPQEASDLLVL